MVELKYWLFIVFMWPYMLVIAKMLLHFISFIAYKIANPICDKKLSAIAANPNIKTEECYKRNRRITRIQSSFYNFNDWFTYYLRFSDLQWWAVYCCISCALCVLSIAIFFSIRSDLKKEQAILESNFAVIRQYDDFENLPMWKYDKAGVIKRAIECNEKYFVTQDGEIRCKFYFIKSENLKDLKPIDVNKMLDAAGISKDAERVLNDKYITGSL